MTRPRPRKSALSPRLEGLELRALLSAGDYGQWPLRGADPSSSLIVKFSGPPGGAAARADLDRFGAYIEQTYDDGASLVVLGQGVDRAAALAGLEADADVDYAEANAVIRMAVVPNDPSFPLQWGLNNPAGVDVGAVRGWNGTTGSASTVVAVVDTGIDMTNPDLAPKLWTNPADGSHGYNFVANTNSPQDDNGHGSHVAGIIAAATNNGVGVAGVNWNARVMALKFLDGSGSGSTANAVSAIQFAVNHGAKVINASWGGPGGDPALQDEINWAGTQGVVFVAAAGNSGSNNDATPFYPAAYHLPNMLTVAAVDPLGNLASFSNYGPTTVDVAAPGVGIYSTYLTSQGGYATLSGTSMATPFVTGLVSLLDGLYPGDTPQQIVSLVKASVRPLPGLQGKIVTGGIIDVGNAILGPGPAPTPTIKVSDGTTAVANGGADAFGSTVAGTPLTRTFTVTDVGNAPLTLVDPVSVPPGFSLASDFASVVVAPGLSTTFAVRLDAAAAGSYSGPVSFGTNDPANLTFSFNASGTVTQALPQLKVSDGSTAIANGGADPFGSTVVGSPLSRSITVTNAGAGTLTLADPISLPPGFSLAADFGSKSVGPGGSTSFAVTLTAAAAGSYSGAITFGSNDPANLTFSFIASGTVAAAAAGNPLAPFFGRDGLVADGSAFAVGLDGGSFALSANLLGGSLTSGGATFALGAAGSPNAVAAAGQVVPLPQGTYSTLSLLGMGTYGAQAGQVFTVRYTDGSTQSFLQGLSDWWSPQGFAGESVAASTPYIDTAGGGRAGQGVDAYRYDLALNPTKAVASITLPDNSHVVLLSVALQAAAVSNPLAPFFGRDGLVADGSAFAVGLDGGSFALSANLLGNSLTSGGATFALGAAGSPNAVAAAGQVVPLPQGTYSTLSLLGMGTYGAQAGQVFTVRYTDGSTQSFLQGLSDWWSPQGFAGESVAASTPYIDTAGGGRVGQGVDAYRYDLALNPTKAVASITLPDNSHVVLLSVALH